MQDKGKQKLPLGKGSAEQIVVKYTAGGYTPGDTWELFLGSDNRVEEFIYRRGGPKKPSLVITTWAGYKKAGPLLISTDHRGTADGKPVQHLLLGRVRQAGRIRHLDKGTVDSGRGRFPLMLPTGSTSIRKEALTQAAEHTLSITLKKRSRSESPR